jgi:hypothetical protein
MLRVTMSVSAEGAEQYFDAALKKSDYYAKEQGVWGGKGAERLGLKGEVTREDLGCLIHFARTILDLANGPSRETVWPQYQPHPK